jgi:hypothetical protein
MLLTKNSYAIHWYYDADIATGSNIVMPVGSTNGNFTSPVLNVVNVADLNYFQFWFLCTIGTTTVRLDFYGGLLPTTLVNWLSFNYVTTGVPVSVYNLPAPHGGPPGKLTLPMPFLQINIVVGGVGNATALQFEAKAWRD